MRVITSRKLVAVAVGLIVLGLFTGNALGDEVRWSNATAGDYLWSGPNWVDTTGAAHAPPVAGDKIAFLTSDSLADAKIDMAGATIDLPGSSLGHGYGGRNWSFYDSATLTPSGTGATDFAGTHASLEAASSASSLLLKVQNSDWSKSGTPRFFLPVEITGTFKTPEAGTLEFYGPTTINHHVEPRNKGWNSKLYFRNTADITTMDVIFRNGVDGEDAFFYGATTIGTLNQDGGQIFLKTGSTATIGTFNLSRGEFVTEIVPTITTMNWTGGIWGAGADGALPSTTPFSLGAGQTLKLDAVQTASPVITVEAGGALAGDMTNMVYSGAGQNVIFQNDAVHAPTVGTGPTLQLSDLAAGVGVWLGVTTKGASDTWQAGLTGTSPYKGLAFDSNAFTPSGETRSTFKANTDSGDLLLRVDNLLDCEYRGPNWIGDGTSTTANFDMVSPTARIDLRRHFNQGSTDADRILTFNITRDTPHASDILTTNQQPGVYADQTINVSGGKVKMSAMISRFLGNMTITDGILARPADFTATDTGTLTLAGSTFVEMTSPDPANLNTFEALGNRLVYPAAGDPTGQVTVVLAGNNGTYALDYSATGATPVLAGLLQNADITRTSYKGTTFSSDLQLGHGKFLYNLYERTNGNAVKGSVGTEKIVYAGNGPMDGTDWIGFAAMRANTTINMAVDAGSAIVQVGTADPDRLSHRLGGPIVSEIPTNQVTFQQDVTAAGVNMQSGTGQFNQDLDIKTLNLGADVTLKMANGKTATVNESLSGEGTWSGGNGIALTAAATVAPGNEGVGTLSGGLLSLESSSTYAWDITDPDGESGTGWDLLLSNAVDLGSDSSVLNVVLTDVDLVRDIEANDEFVIAATPSGDFTTPTNWSYSVTAAPEIATWDVSGAQLLFDQRDVGGSLMNVLYLTGVATTLTVVPEPTSILLAVMGLLALLGIRHRRVKITRSPLID